jgi:hypothetical protein
MRYMHNYDQGSSVTACDSQCLLINLQIALISRASVIHYTQLERPSLTPKLSK